MEQFSQIGVLVVDPGLFCPRRGQVPKNGPGVPACVGSFLWAARMVKTVYALAYIAGGRVLRCPDWTKRQPTEVALTVGSGLPPVRCKDVRQPTQERS